MARPRFSLSQPLDERHPVVTWRPDHGVDPNQIFSCSRPHEDARTAPSLPTFHQEGLCALSRSCLDWLSSTGFWTRTTHDASRRSGTPLDTFAAGTRGKKPASEPARHARIDFCVFAVGKLCTLDPPKSKPPKPSANHSAPNEHTRQATFTSCSLSLVPGPHSIAEPRNKAPRTTSRCNQASWAGSSLHICPVYSSLIYTRTKPCCPRCHPDLQQPSFPIHRTTPCIPTHQTSTKFSPPVSRSGPTSRRRPGQTCCPS